MAPVLEAETADARSAGLGTQRGMELIGVALAIGINYELIAVMDGGNGGGPGIGISQMSGLSAKLSRPPGKGPLGWAWAWSNVSLRQLGAW